MRYLGVSHILLVNKQNYLHKWLGNQKIGGAVATMITTAAHSTLN